MKKKEFEALLASGEAAFETIISLNSGRYDGQGATVTAKYGIELISSDITLVNFNIIGKITVKPGASNIIIENCRLSAEGDAFVSLGSSVELRSNNINGSVHLHGTNSLAAQNQVKGDICISDAENCSVILNKAQNIKAIDGKNIFIVDNAVENALVARNNDRIIADGNSFGSLEAEDNKRENGNSLMDVDERVEFGANERLLPKTDKELFVGVPRKAFVRDAYLGDVAVDEYIREKAKTQDTVILAPGVYSSETVYLGAEHGNTSIYGYGAMLEQTIYGGVIYIRGIDGLSLNGLTFGYAVQSSYQFHILDIDRESGEILTVPAAGMSIYPGQGSAMAYSTDKNKVRSFSLYSGALYPWGTWRSGGGRENADGTFTFLSLTDQPSYTEKLKKGDVLANRIAANIISTCDIIDSRNISLRDIVNYGYSAALAFAESNNHTSTRYLRVHNTTPPPYIIEKRTYEYYKSLEEGYGVALEVFIDENGRCRGSTQRYGSVDATHIMCCDEGITATSCLFEYMCDDGSNHRASSARLHKVTDNGDGTATLQYKHNLGEIYFRNYNKKDGSLCPPFRAGDRVYIYTSNGELFCDTPALEETREVGVGINKHTEGEYKILEIKVSSDDLRMDVLEGYDLSDDHYSLENKVFVDNTSRNSQGFCFDNVLVQGIRSRGFMVKAPNGKITHCTYRDLDMAGVACKAEVEWSESTIAKDITISHNLFDNTGRFNNDPSIRMYAPIIIEGLCKHVKPGSLLHSNIVIDGNKFMNCQNKYGIFVNSVYNVKIRNNVFCPIENETPDNLGISIEIDTAMDVEISGNTYSPNVRSPRDAIRITNSKDIYGADMTDGELNL